MRTTGRSVFPQLLAIALILVVLSSVAVTQTSTSAISGVIGDQNGRVISGATVTLINVTTSAIRTQTTSSNGNYSFELLPPGEYRLEAEASGFRKEVVVHVRALVGKSTEQNIKLNVGGASESVTVNAESGQALINTQDASLGNNFIAQQITQLPLEARNVLSLLTLQPGVTRQGYVSGARSDQSNVTLDGVDINEAQTNAVAGTGSLQNNGGGVNSVGSSSTATAEQGPVLRLNSEAIEEFRVATATSNATGGRGSAAQIALVTKSGNNKFHGAAFESHRNTIFTANDYFNILSGVKRPSLIRNTFGGGIGGPIIKNKVFFFYSYEGRRDASQTTVLPRPVPLPSLGQGLVKYPDPLGNITTLTSAQITSIFPAVGVNPAAVAALAAAAAKYPANDFTTGDSKPGRLLNTAGFRFNAPTPIKLNSHAARLDFNINNAQSLFLRANAIDDHLIKASQFPDTAAPGEWDHPWGIAVGHTWTIHNTLVNSFRYGLTRQAFSQLGDSQANNVNFRFVYSPLLFTRTLARTNPVQNYVDDVNWIKGAHTIQFGVNSAIISNARSNFGNAYDTATANPSFYPTGVIRNPVNAAFPIGSGASSVENAITALIGRFSQYTARFTFAHDGSLLPSGTASNRDFKNWGVEGYVQDVWKVKSNFTLTYGLRYSLWRPVYEANGFEAKPDIPLGTFFERRLAGAAAGTPYNQPIAVVLSGSANNATPLYRWDKTNFQPRVAVAWSPRASDGLMGMLFGKENQSVLRGGFSLNGDYYGQAVASFFDTNNTLGFGSDTTISANTYNVSTRPAPAFTGFDQAIRPLPGITVPTSLSFPQMKAPDGSTRIESSLDENLVTPKSYSWSATFERQLRGGLVFDASYVGRVSHHLLLTRDIMALNNLVDKKSGVDWYTAATQLEKLRQMNVPISQIQAIPYFENIFSNKALLSSEIAANEGVVYPVTFSATQMIYADAFDNNKNDWTPTQLDINHAAPSISSSLFYEPQYGALSAFSSVGSSNYNGLSVSLRERYKDASVDFNYTYAHSLDDSSGLQSSTGFGNAFQLNPIRPGDNYASSDFDIRHLINISGVVPIPVGRGRAFFNSTNSVVNGIIGGWQVSNIFRWNTGLPISTPIDDARWATNWNVQSSTTMVTPFQACPTRGATPNLFGCNPTTAFQSLRNAYPGETGQRNVFRLPGYVDMDMGLGKSFHMPYAENHELQFRWEVFNVSNTQRMGQVIATRTGYGVPADPSGQKPASDFGNFTGIQGTPRAMQFTLRYSF